MSNTTPHVSRLYVSAPTDLDLRPLLDGLKRRGTQPYVLSDVAQLGADIVESLQRAIQQADRVIVVLGDAPASNPIFEAGFAAALGKPLLIIAPPGAAVPADLAGQLIARAGPDDLDAINFALDQVERGTPTDRRRALPPIGRPLGSDYARRILEFLSSSAVDEQSTIALLVEAIEASGGVAVVSADRDVGFDIGVWSDDLASIGGNPLLVEVKRTLMPGAVDQALRSLGAHPSAQLALVVYLAPPADDRPPSRAELNEARFPVLIISLQELIERMASASFAEVVRQLRNRSAHGLDRS
jgi:hypothetical protein